MRRYFCTSIAMEKLKRKTRMMLAIEVAIYLVIAISVALLIIL